MGPSRQSRRHQSRITRIAAALVGLLAAASAGAHETAMPPGTHSKNIRLAANAVHLECLDVAAGRRLAYVFTAPRIVRFNIHYQAGNELFYPVRRDTRHVHGVYAPLRAQRYCMTWTNPHVASIDLSYSYIVRSGSR